MPKLIYVFLEVSYAAVFNPGDTFTADPKRHLEDARRNLKRNATLHYVALDLRFALERIVHHELSLSEAATLRMLDENDPRKKLSNLLGSIRTQPLHTRSG